MKWEPLSASLVKPDDASDASLACLVAASSLSGGFCPQIAPPAEPAWVDLVSSSFSPIGSPGTSLLFDNLNTDPRTPGQRLPYTVQVPPSPIGAIDTDTPLHRLSLLRFAGARRGARRRQHRFLL